MKILSLLVSVSALAAASACSAAGYSFSPVGRFTATGTSYLARPFGFEGVTCSTTVTGKVAKSGKAQIMTVVFGGGDTCNLISALHTPWTGKPMGATTADLFGVSMHPVNGAICGPEALLLSVDGSGEWNAQVRKRDDCTITFSWSTNPPVTLVPTP